MAPLGLMLLGLMTGLVRSEMSSCYKYDQTWSNTTLLLAFTSVPDPGECQLLCQDTAECVGWTWTSEDYPDYPSHCYTFSAIGSTSPSSGCVSGPPSCLCSKTEECQMSEDNELEVITNIYEERDCQDLCAANSDCAFYTWYDNMAGIPANVCILLSNCEERDSSCSSCHTAPVPCSHQMGPTSTPASTTPTTTSAPATEAFIISGGSPSDSAGNSV